MITIYHNNRCSKSRQGLKLLEDSGKEFTVINYLNDVPTVADLKQIIAFLGISPIQLIRKNEAIWKEQYKSLNLSDAQVIEAMIKHPKLIERPIVIHNDKAIIGRPPELILEIL